MFGMNQSRGFNQFFASLLLGDKILHYGWGCLRRTGKSSGPYKDQVWSLSSAADTNKLSGSLEVLAEICAAP